MGLEDSDLLADGGRKAASPISCSICLEDVTDYGDRAWAKLLCGHQFHLDCIGSAFNVKGVMQCPNCRKVEKGQWLYADGGKPYPELNIDDLVHDEDMYDLGYSESSMWCPFGGFTRFAAAFDEVEIPAIGFGYNEIVGEQHSTSTTHICPYVAYVHPSASSASATANVGGDGNRFNNNNNQWNNSSQSEIPNPYGYVDHPSIMPTRTNVDFHLPTSGSYSFLADQSSTRGPSSISSSMNHPYPAASAARALERSQAFQAYFHQPTTMRSHRSNGQQLQLGSSSDQTHGAAGVYHPSSSRSFQEAENSMLNPFQHIWERDPFMNQGGGGSGSSSGSGRHRNGGSERTSSQMAYWL